MAFVKHVCTRMAFKSEKRPCLAGTAVVTFSRGALQGAGVEIYPGSTCTLSDSGIHHCKEGILIKVGGPAPGPAPGGRDGGVSGWDSVRACGHQEREGTWSGVLWERCAGCGPKGARERCAPRSSGCRLENVRV